MNVGKKDYWMSPGLQKAYHKQIDLIMEYLCKRRVQDWLLNVT